MKESEESPATDRLRRAAEPVGRRAVVAEDEALIRMDIVETLEEGGYDVVGEAANGEEAIAAARELRPDVVVMDIKMPVMDGITAAETIVKERLAPVVLLTAFSQTELVERARDAGAMAYVVKPFTPADLLPAVEIARVAPRGDARRSRRRSPTSRSAWRPASASSARRASSGDDVPSKSRVVPLDSEDLDGPTPHHARGRGRRHPRGRRLTRAVAVHARSRRHSDVPRPLHGACRALPVTPR